MIEHQLEALQSEAWGVSGEEHTLDFARRVREYLEAQGFETGDSALEGLPDIVQHICGHAEAIERRQAEQAIPWQTKLADLIREAHEKRLEVAARERKEMLLKYPYLGSVIYGYDPSRKTPEELAEFKRTMEEIASEFVVNDIIAAGTKEEDKAGAWDLAPPLTNSLIHIEESNYPEGMFGPPGNPEEGEPTRSDIIREMCEERGIPVIDIPLSDPGDPEDWKGLPIPPGFVDECIMADPTKIEAINAINRERERGDKRE